MKRYLKNFMLSLIFLAFVPTNIRSQTTEGFIGTWKVNLEKSKYDPGPPPKASTRIFEDWGGGLYLSMTKGVSGKDLAEWGHVVFKFDGRDYPYASSAIPGTTPVFTTISYKRIDANTFENTVKREGKISTTNTYTISKDGKTLTQRQKGTDAQGKAMNNLVVWEKQ